jgi:putative ABC transport system permease protein
MILAILAQTYRTLSANKLRSFLTMFGIAWGIMSLILMTAIGEGFRVGQKESLKTLGKDIMIIWGGRTSVQAEGYQAGRIVRLRYSDYEFIRERAGLIRSISPEIIRGDLVAKTDINNGTFGLHGIIPEYQYMRTLEIHWGRPMNEADNEQSRPVCILGSDVNQQLFNSENSVGRSMTIGGRPFTVIAVMPYKDQNNSYSGQDRREIFIPFNTMRKLFSNPGLGQDTDRLNNMIAMPVDPQVHEAAEKEVRALLAERHRFDPVDEDAVSIWNTARQAKLMDSMLLSMQWFLATVGLVTLLLGSIGVINIMLISVRERTVEIGVRKSVGARRKDILLQFFAESFSLAAVSGFVGLTLGWGVCALINGLGVKNQIFAGAVFTPGLAVVAVGVLTLVGLASGIYPAHTAAEMDPIEALRYEAN